MNSDYNDFVARVALEVVDSAWWKQQLRVKSAGSRTTALSSSNKGHRGSRYSPPVTTLTANTKQVNKINDNIAFQRLDANWERHKVIEKDIKAGLLDRTIVSQLGQLF
jgi:hypothetical protein